MICTIGLAGISGYFQLAGLALFRLSFAPSNNQFLSQHTHEPNCRAQDARRTP